MPDEPRCDNCRFVVLNGNSDEYECRRYPPVTLVTMPSRCNEGNWIDADIIVRWPEVAEHQWCGEHQSIPLPPPLPPPRVCPKCMGVYVACDTCRGTGIMERTTDAQ